MREDLLNSSLTGPMTFFSPSVVIVEKEEDDSHLVPVFDYPTWGLAENSDLQPTQIVVLPFEKTVTAVAILSKYVDLTGFALKSSGIVKHYQGKDQISLSLIWLRFERENGKNNGIGGEHISVTVDITEGKVMGLTRMQASLSGDAYVSHQAALTHAIEFLKIAAPDLMPKNAIIPTINSLTPGTRIDFSPELKIGNVEIHWINDHKEDVVVGLGETEVHGMKVKMFIPSSELWAWVVVDKNGNIETFERNIFWNFSEFRRETQMWLHDKWLSAQEIAMPNFLKGNKDMPCFTV